MNYTIMTILSLTIGLLVWCLIHFVGYSQRVALWLELTYTMIFAASVIGLYCEDVIGGKKYNINLVQTQIALHQSEIRNSLNEELYNKPMHKTAWSPNNFEQLVEEHAILCEWVKLHKDSILEDIYRDTSLVDFRVPVISEEYSIAHQLQSQIDEYNKSVIELTKLKLETTQLTGRRVVFEYFYPMLSLLAVLLFLLRWWYDFHTKE